MALKPISLDKVDRFTLLVIGPAGIGKTSLLRTIPEDQNICVLSAESGLLSVRDLVQSGRVQGFEIASFGDMTEAYQMLLADEAKNAFDWIVIDSLTEISARCVEAMTKKHTGSDNNFAKWGEYNDLMTGLIKGFRDLDAYNVLFTALPSVEKDDSNRRFIGPAISGGQLKDRLTSYFDNVFYMEEFRNAEDGSTYRAFVTQPWERYPAKSRQWYSDQFNLIEKPDLAHIQRRIKGE